MAISARWRATLLGAFAVAVYAGAIPGGYAFDDSVIVRENPVVQGDVPLTEAFTRDFWGKSPPAIGLYRPLVTVSFALEHRLLPKPWLSHAGSVLLHSIVVALIYAVGRGIFGEGVAILAALFAATFAAPAEAVQSLAGRADVLAAFFAIAGLAAHRRSGTLGAVLASMALGAGLLCKESAAFFPIAWFVVDFLGPEAATPLRKRWRRFAAYGAVIAAYALVRWRVLGASYVPYVGPLENPLGAAHGMSRIFGAAHVLLTRYVFGMIDPFRRLYVCSAPDCGGTGASDWLGWAGLIVLAAIISAVPLTMRRRPAIAAGLGWFLVFFLPLSNVIIPSSTSYGERLLYVPTIGLAWAVAAAVTNARDRRILVGAFLVWLTLNAASVQIRNRDWRSQDELYLSGLDAAPSGAMVQANAAYAFFARHDAVQAEAHARRALELYRPYPLATSVLASSVDRQGRVDEAEHYFREALAEQHDSRIVEDYARFLALHQRRLEAAALLQAELKRDPLNPPLRELLRSVDRHP